MTVRGEGMKIGIFQMIILYKYKGASRHDPIQLQSENGST